MLGHLKLPSALPMHDPRPAGMIVDDVAIGEDFVLSDQDAGTKSQLIAVRVWNLDLINGGFGAVGIGVCIREVGAQQ